LAIPKYIQSAIQTDRRRNCTRGHAKGKVPSSSPDYTIINRRMNRLDIKIKDTDSKVKEFKEEYIVIAIVSTGIKVTNRGLSG
jgi:hypothetical protein